MGRPIEVSSAIDIDAPIETVWRVLTDFGGYARWNPFVTGIEAPQGVGVGKPLRLSVRLPSGTRTSATERITAWSDLRDGQAAFAYEMASPLSSLGLLRVGRTQRLERIDDRRCRYSSVETFEGPLRRLVPLAEIERGTSDQTDGLKWAAEGPPEIEPQRPPMAPMSRLEQTRAFSTDPARFLRETAQRVGPVFRTHLVGDGVRVWVGSSAVAKRVFGLKHDELEVSNNVPLNLGERALLYVGGDVHRHHRRVLTPPFVGERMKAYGQSMVRHTEEAIERHQGDVVLSRFLQEITLAVVLECMFGVHDREQQARLLQVVPQWTDAILTPTSFALALLVGARRIRGALDWMARSTPVRRGRSWPAIRPPSAWRRLSDPKAELDRTLYELIAAARANDDGERQDVLAMLVRSTFDDGSPLDDEDVHDQLLTLLVAGHETTANTVAWTWHHLLMHPEIVEQLRREQREVFGPAGGVDPERLSELRLLGAVLSESMRITPIAIGVTRRTRIPIEADGYRLEPGDEVIPTPYVLHFDPELWPEPDKFDPSRWLGDDPRPPQHRYMPFGGGRRICLGAAFADQEMRIILSAMLQRLDVGGRAGPRAAMMKGLTLVPADGVPVTLTHRPR